MSQQLQVEVSGQGQNLVLLHGWGVNSGVWQSLLPELQRDFRVHCIDLPGFGLNTQRLPADYSLPELAAMVDGVIPADSWVLGWSLGGLVATQLALTSSQIKRLLLVASSPKFMASDTWPGISAPVLDMFSEQLSLSVSKTLKRFLAIQAMGSDSARRDAKTISDAVDHRPQPSAEVLHAGLNLLRSVDLRQQVHAIRVPVDICLGRLDSLVPIKAQPGIEACFQQITSHVVAHASHAPFISHPQEFLDWLRQLR